jgi:hypothetical protein
MEIYEIGHIKIKVLNIWIASIAVFWVTIS